MAASTAVFTAYPAHSFVENSFRVCEDAVLFQTRGGFSSAKLFLQFLANGDPRFLGQNLFWFDMTQTQLELATAAARLGVFEWYIQEDRPIWGNERMFEIFGRSREEGPLTRCDLPNYLHPDDKAPFQQELGRAIANQMPFKARCRVRRKNDGEYRWIQYTARIEYSPDGMPLRMLGVIEDITEDVAATSELENTKQTLASELKGLLLLQELTLRLVQPRPDAEALQDVLDTAIALTHAQKGTLQLATPNETQLRIVSQSGFGRGFLDFFESVSLGSGASGTVLPDKRRALAEDVQKSAIFANTPLLAVLEREGVRAVQSMPLLNHEGELLGVLTTHYLQPHSFGETELRLLDILGRHVSELLSRRHLQLAAQAADEALRKSEHRFRAFVTASSDVVYCMSADWTEMRRLEGREFIADTESPSHNWLSKYIHPQDQPTVLAAIHRAIKSKDVFELEHRVLQVDGTLGWTFSRAVPLMDFKGEITEWFGAAQDITKRKEAEEALRKAQQVLADHAQSLEKTVQERTAKLHSHVAQLEEFSYTVSHDLRAPLRAMNGYATILLEEYGGQMDARARGLIEHVIKAAKRMDYLTQDVLTYSKLARQDIAIHAVNLEEVIQEILEHYPNIKTSKAEVNVRPPLLSALGNESLLTQALSNLIGNAVKFIAPGQVPRIEIWCERFGNKVRLLVKDNGIGIKPEHQGKLFGAFERVNPKTFYEGTGMGLAIVRKAMERMGGNAGLESDGTNGSTFWVELPASSEE